MALLSCGDDLSMDGDHGGMRFRLPVAEFLDLRGQSREFGAHRLHVLEQKFVRDGSGHVPNMRLARRAVKHRHK